MKPFITTLFCLCTFALAQGNISGTLYATEVKGFVVIGCLLDLSPRIVITRKVLMSLLNKVVLRQATPYLMQRQEIIW